MSTARHIICLSLIVLMAALAFAPSSPAAAQENAPPLAAAPLAAPVGTPLCGPTQNVGGAIAANTTWAAGKVYVLTGDITVNQLTTLTIQPGAVIKSNWDRGFTINGKLVANGTAEHPIYFTSIKDDSICGDTNGDTTASVPNPGDWRWIDFTEVSDPQSKMSYAVVRFGGRDNCGNYCDYWRAPIRMTKSVPQIESITFEKNVRNAAAIVGGDWLSSELKSTNIVLILESNLNILQANTFIIPAGVKLKPEFDQGITVNGKLIARGTVDSPIVFTSVQDDSICGIGAAGEPICDTNNNTTASVPATGDWRWIDFTSVSDPGSEISRAIIRYGGRDHCGNYCDHWRAPVRMDNVSPSFDFITFEKNWHNAVGVVGNTWLTNGLHSTTVIHFLEGGLTVPQANTFAFAADVKMKFAFDNGIHIDGTLLIQGSADEPVILTSDRDDEICGIGANGELVCDTNNDMLASVPATGDWRWITFSSLSSQASLIDHAIFRYGGRDHCGNYCDHWRAVVRLESAAPTITNSAFVDNWSGIDLIGGAQPTLTCNDFEDNESPYGIYSDTPATAVDARNTWWGSASGPTHAGNPHGQGQQVTNGVDYAPWRTTPCILPPQAPDAAFEATPTSGEAPLSVSFFNTSAGAVSSSQWQFGDGTTGTGINPTHVYTQPGVYSVTLTVNGPAGSDTVTNTAYIQVGTTTYRMFAPMIVRPRR